MAIGTTAALLAGTVGSAALGAAASKKAASAQADATKSAQDAQERIFERSVELTAPQRQIGQNALAQMAYLSGVGPQPYVGMQGQPLRIRKGDGRYLVEQFVDDEWSPTSNTFKSRGAAARFLEPRKAKGFQQTPGYQFRLEEGTNALEKMAAARGLRMGSPTLKAAQRYGEGLAADEYNTYVNRLAGLAGTGQTATSQQIGAGQNFANAFGNAAMQGGQARASGYQGVGQALQGGLGNAFNVFGMAQSGMLGPTPGFGITPSPTGLSAWGYA